MLQLNSVPKLPMSWKLGIQIKCALVSHCFRFKHDDGVKLQRASVTTYHVRDVKKHFMTCLLHCYVTSCVVALWRLKHQSHVPRLCREHGVYPLQSCVKTDTNTNEHQLLLLNSNNTKWRLKMQFWHWKSTFTFIPNELAQRSHAFWVCYNGFNKKMLLIETVT